MKNDMLIIAFGKIVAGMDRTTGKRRWEYVLDTASMPRLAVTDDQVCVLSSAGLVCLDLETGRAAWEAAVFGDSMLCDGRFVFIGHAGEVQCLSMTDGKVVWHDTFKGKGVYPVALGIPGFVSQIDRAGT